MAVQNSLFSRKVISLLRRMSAILRSCSLALKDQTSYHPSCQTHQWHTMSCICRSSAGLFSASSLSYSNSTKISTTGLATLKEAWPSALTSNSSVIRQACGLTTRLYLSGLARTNLSDKRSLPLSTTSLIWTSARKSLVLIS